MRPLQHISKMGIALLLFPFFVLAQPSGDAGVGRLGTFGEEVVPLTKKEPLRVGVGTYFSTGKHQVSYVTPYTRIGLRLSSDVQISAEFTANHISQSAVGNIFGAGDALVAMQYFIPTSIKANFVVNTGFRLPTGNGNYTSFLEPAQPLFLQPSLGSTDFLLGFSFQFEGITSGFALQIPLSQSRNRFLPIENTNQSPPFDALPTRYLNRGVDLALYFKQDIQLKQGLFLQVGATPILRFGRSSFLNENDDFEEVLGSNGLTLNVFSGVSYAVQSWVFTLEGGLPITQIDQKLDGLHRYFFTGFRCSKRIGKGTSKPKTPTELELE